MAVCCYNELNSCTGWRFLRFQSLATLLDGEASLDSSSGCAFKSKIPLVLQSLRVDFQIVKKKKM